MPSQLSKRKHSLPYPNFGASPIPRSLNSEIAFFEKLHRQLDKHFSDPVFGVPALCLCVGMSRSGLFRKLTSLTGRNIEDYLRSYRLGKAYELLQTTDLLVKEIAYDCGFYDPAHFARAFHAEFGFPPSHLRS